MKRLGLTLTVGLLLCGVPAQAHDGPEHEIDELTERIAKEGMKPDLLIQRAIEYNVVGDATNALRDLEKAMSADASSALAHRELSRTLFVVGRTNDALAAAEAGLKQISDPADRAALLIVRAEIQQARGEYKKALADTEQALRTHDGDVDWYLLRSQLHSALNMKAERIKGLENGLRVNGSGALEGEWIDALIDAGRNKQALAKVEESLAASRTKSTWLIRRAKVRLATGKAADAKRDLEAALIELTERLRGGGTPDPFLLADRASAQELLGRKEEALRDYEQARDKGLNEFSIRERIRFLKATATPVTPAKEPRK
jgi:tetratricopeptide (TPR) repeat protein